MHIVEVVGNDEHGEEDGERERERDMVMASAEHVCPQPEVEQLSFSNCTTHFLPYDNAKQPTVARSSVLVPLAVVIAVKTATTTRCLQIFLFFVGSHLTNIEHNVTYS